MSKRFSMIMLAAAIVCSLFYYLAIKFSGAGTVAVSVDPITPSEAVLAQVEVMPEEVVVKVDRPEIYYCLVTKATFQKMADFGMKPSGYLQMGGSAFQDEVNHLDKTSAFLIMNYVNIVSTDIKEKQVYYLMMGSKNADGLFTDELTECIKIEP